MSNELAKSGEILLYSYDGAKEFINVYFKDETFWLTQSASTLKTFLKKAN